MTVMTRTQIKKELSALPQDEFKGRLKDCLRLTENCGWGVYDTLGEYFYEFYPPDWEE